MRRSSLALLRCPRCGGGPLEAEGDKALLGFGPVRCATCHMAYPLAEGILDLLVPPDHAPPLRRSLAQRAMELRPVARFYERGLRPALSRLSLDAESERFLARALLAPPPGAPLLDLSCGTGHLARDLAMRPGAGPVFGLDRSAAMLEEAHHQLSESGATVELIRADAAHLPFRDEVFAGVLDVAALHLYDEPSQVLAEVARTLAPGGAFVCATLLEGLKPLDRLERKVGIRRFEEAELRRLCDEVGLVGFERLLLPPWIVFRVTKPEV
ncbi:methyltransferase domain-containing protein [Vulgatibacter incomptus]|uniref:Methyltransferase n=1 Tax=Vulgatibacter incomptus TaxID=1391653 RepID=A0A0K1PAE6_9BACT|nr:methyltransferase domain-containing protein [Vulgatibacter incomptus]AKU90089.1 methyltransferase [Vulgatibacter incomptus]